MRAIDSPHEITPINMILRNFKIFRFSLQYTHLFPELGSRKHFYASEMRAIDFSQEVVRPIWQVKQRWISRFDPIKAKILIYKKIFFEQKIFASFFVRKVFLYIEIFAIVGSNLRAQRCLTCQIGRNANFKL